MSNDNTADALRRATNAVTVAGERLIGPEIDERTVALGMLAAGVATLSRLMPAADLREHLARLADGMGEPAPAMIHDPDLTILSEDLSDSPGPAAIRDTVRSLIEGGHETKAIVDALLTVAMVLACQVDGPEMTAVRLVAAGKVLAERSAPPPPPSRNH